MRLILFCILFFTFTASAQTPTCTASFVYSLSPNGTVTFSNTSVNTTTAGAIYVWDTGNGLSFTTTSVSQTVSTTYTINGMYQITLMMTSLNPMLCSGGFSDQIFCILQGCPLSASMAALSSAPYSPTVNFTSVSTGTNSGTTYSWYFGDGTTATGVNPTHIYLSNGGFNCKLIATNSSTCSAFVESYAYGPNAVGLIGVCAYTPALTYTAGLSGAVNFSVSSTGYTWDVLWNFADAPNGTVPTRTPSISHVYFNGTYNMDVYLFNTFMSNCGPFSYSTAITITNNSCYSNAAFTYTQGSNGSVQFSTTSPSTYTNIAYSWYFGDGVSSTQLNPTHIYNNAGIYRAVLISYDLAYPLASPLDTFGILCRTFSTANLSITSVPCVANSNFSMQPNWTPQAYVIVPAYPYNISSAVWDWGDGTVSNVLYAYHTYSAAGFYNICLTLTTTCGTTSSVCANQYLSKGQSGDMLYVSVVAPEISNSIYEKSAYKHNFELYPNPSTDGLLNLVLDLGFSETKIEVYDLTGKQVAEISPPLNQKAIQMDFSALNNGIYFLRISSPEKCSTNKFIISK